MSKIVAKRKGTYFIRAVDGAYGVLTAMYVSFLGWNIVEKTEILCG